MKNTGHKNIFTGLDPARDRSIYPDDYPGILRNILRYYKVNGCFPNFRSPTTFNEKVWHRLVYDRRRILTILADKYEARRIIETKFGSHHLPQLIMVVEDVNQIEFQKLPQRYVIKANHGSGWVYIVGNNQKINKQDIINICQCWLAQNYYSRKGEWAYKDIKKKILIEELLLDGNELPNDYKIFVFNGKAKLVQIDIDRFGIPKKQFLMVDDKIEGHDSYPHLDDVPISKDIKPMIEFAESAFPKMDFCRVDMYSIGGKPYFGEITLYPGAGVAKYVNGSLDIYLGKCWRLDPAINKLSVSI